VRPALACFFGMAFGGLGCRQLASIEDIELALDASGADASKDGSRDASEEHAREASATCKKIEVDAGVPDALPDAVCSVTGACTPDPLVGFKPTWVPPRAHEKSCTATEISDLYDSCFGRAETMTSCGVWMTAHPGCQACVYSSSTDTAYGPVINDVISNLQTLNVGGCVALLEPCNLECAHGMQASEQCFEKACDSSCPPVTSEATYNQVVACQTSAETCPCQAYTELLTQCEDTIAARASPAFTCVQANMVVPAAFKQMVSLFCGE
jgi:hypothetical protein